MSDVLLPQAGNFAECKDAGAGVLAALGVVGRGRGQSMREMCDALRHAAVKFIDRKARQGRIAADFVQCVQLPNPSAAPALPGSLPTRC